MAFADDWPADAPMSPFWLVSWREACRALDCSSNTLLRLCAGNGVGVVRLNARKRALLARDLLQIVRAKQRPAASYAAVTELQEARHA